MAATLAPRAGMVTLLDAAREAVGRVVDPEIPVLGIMDLGIVARVEIVADSVEIDIMPTYSGCPALAQIEADIRGELAKAGFANVVVTTVQLPVWSTDRMSEHARRQLSEFGIAPPGATSCPRCSSVVTTTVSFFGSTACKALMVCDSCLEPFDRFKEF